MLPLHNWHLLVSLNTFCSHKNINCTKINTISNIKWRCLYIFLSFKLKLVSIRLLLHLKCILCKIITNCHRLSPSNWTRKARIPYNKNIRRFNMFSVYIISKIFHYSRRRVQTQLFIIIYHFLQIAHNYWKS